jgi:hypothetical protein
MQIDPYGDKETFGDGFQINTGDDVPYGDKETFGDGFQINTGDDVNVFLHPVLLPYIFPFLFPHPRFLILMFVS